MHVGSLLKQLRKEQNMTLMELSEKSGVALGTLSRIENGRMPGTIKSHESICKVLGTTLPELYMKLPSSKRTLEIKTKASESDVIVYDKTFSYKLLTVNTKNKKVTPLLLTITRAGRTATEESRPGVDKFIYVLHGNVEINIGKEKHSLKYENTIYFDSSVPHYFKNTGKSEARLICIVCQPMV